MVRFMTMKRVKAFLLLEMLEIDEDAEDAMVGGTIS